jgi:hypothetical protein
LNKTIIVDAFGAILRELKLADVYGEKALI